jgi:hypothetical protein
MHGEIISWYSSNISVTYIEVLPITDLFFPFYVTIFSPMPPHVLLGLCGTPPPAVAVV